MYAVPSKSTVPATAQQANDAPMTWPNCWRAGVAPTRYPVFKSWEMSPAFDAAIATIVPTVRTAARAAPVVQPAAAKTEATPSKVISAMPEVGCDVTPTMPTMRAATATNITPNMPTPAAQIALGTSPMPPAKMPGTRAATATTVTIVPATKLPGKSRSVLGTSAVAEFPPAFLRPRATLANAPIMVGSPRSTVRIPAVATAPAPMYRT